MKRLPMLARSRRGNSARASATATVGWAWAITGIVLGALMATLVFAPAQWLVGPIEQLTQGRVLLQQTRGTVWQGSAQVVLTGGTGSHDQASLPGELRWRLHPGWTQWQLAVSADCCLPQALQVGIQPGIGQLTLTVGNQQSTWPASLLAALGAPWNTLGLDATLTLTTRQAQLTLAQGRTRFDGEVTVHALQASSRLSTLKPLGSYETRLTGGDAPQLTLSTQEGALKLSGQGHWTGPKFRFVGEASADQGSEAALNNLLNIIGRRQGTRSVITLG